MFCFNPRAREGRDAFGVEFLPFQRVSIHAPAKGATLSRNKKLFIAMCFNPRAREGRDTHERVEDCLSI